MDTKQPKRKQMKEILKYYSEPAGEGVFRISPSSLDKFYDCSEVWYNEDVLKNKTFLGNTSSVRGTLVHAFAERAGLKQKLSRDDIEAMEHYVDDQAKQSIDIDPSVIRETYKEMGENIYKHVSQYPPIHVEDYLVNKLTDTTILAGSCDALQKNEDGTYTVVDYKTTTKSIDAVKSGSSREGLGMYRNQLMSYALNYTKLGYKVTGLKAIYITTPRKGKRGKPTKKAPLGNPLKDIDSEIYESYEQITQDDLNKHEKKMLDIDKILSMCKEDPTLVPLFFRENIHSFYNPKDNPVENPKTAFGW